MLLFLIDSKFTAGISPSGPILFIVYGNNLISNLRRANVFYTLMIFHIFTKIKKKGFRDSTLLRDDFYQLYLNVKDLCLDYGIRINASRFHFYRTSSCIHGYFVNDFELN